MVRELDTSTWPDFVRIVDKHNGVWGGCWCTAYHARPGGGIQASAMCRDYKERLVRANLSHSALVYDWPDVIGWCQFGRTAELPARMNGAVTPGMEPPDWRITCFFVDRDRRRQGVARTALAGALRMIAAGGGGTVDAYPIAVGEKTYPSGFLWGGTESMFAAAGFHRVRSIGTRKLIMRRELGRRRAPGEGARQRVGLRAEVG